MTEGVTKGARVPLRQGKIKCECFVKGVRFVVASLTCYLAAQTAAEHLENGCLCLGLYDMFAGGLAAVGSLDKVVEVEGQELVGITLLAQSIPVPYLLEGLYNWHWVGLPCSMKVL